MDDGPDYYDVAWMREGPGGDLGPSGPFDFLGCLQSWGCFGVFLAIVLGLGTLGFGESGVGVIFIFIIAAVIAIGLFFFLPEKIKESCKESKENRENAKRLAQKKRECHAQISSLRLKYEHDLEDALNRFSSEMPQEDFNEFNSFDHRELIENYTKLAIDHCLGSGGCNENNLIGICGHFVKDHLETEKWFFCLKKKWLREYSEDPSHHTPPGSKLDNLLFQVRSYIDSHGIKGADEKWRDFSRKQAQKDGYEHWSQEMIDEFNASRSRDPKINALMNENAFYRSLRQTLDSDEFFFNIVDDRNRFLNAHLWLTKLEANWYPYKKYTLDTLEKAKNDYLTLGPEKANEIWFDYAKKLESKNRNFLCNLEAELRKDMAESAYWQNVPEEKRDRQISRYLKEAKLDLEKLGLDKASKLWLGFIKRSDAERASRQNPRSV